MGRPKKSAPAPVETEPEFESQDIPDEEPAAVIEPDDDDEPETGGNGRSINQAELVRKAVAAGHEKPATGVEYIRKHFGADVDPKYYSVAKSQLKKREAKSSSAPEEPRRSPRPKAAASAVRDYVAPPEKPKASGDQVDLLAAMEAMKPLVAALGADKVKRIADLLG